jgi:hypothetical protein
VCVCVRARARAGVYFRVSGTQALTTNFIDFTFLDRFPQRKHEEKRERKRGRGREGEEEREGGGE